MAEIRVKENETLDSALRRFKRQCARSGVLTELRKREHYEKPSVKRKKKSEAARKRKYKYSLKKEEALLPLFLCHLGYLASPSFASAFAASVNFASVGTGSSKRMVERDRKGTSASHSVRSSPAKPFS